MFSSSLDLQTTITVKAVDTPQTVFISPASPVVGTCENR